MAEHYDPSVPSEERARFVEWFAICWQHVDSDGHFDSDAALKALEANRKAKSAI